MKSGAAVTLWRLCYGIVALGPLGLSFIQLDPGRGFWVNLSVAAGFVALSLLGLQFLLAARWARIAMPLGTDVMLQFHRQITVLIVILALGHPTILFVWDSRFLALLDVVHAPIRAQLAVLSVLALLVLTATSIWRRRFHLSYSSWQALHAALALVIAVAALAHVLLVGYYVDQPWEKLLWIVYSAVFIWIGIWVRVIKPIQRARRRLRVVSVTEDAANSYVLELEPISPGAFGPRGLEFAPGQFAWIMVGRSPFAMTYHPFSYASSAADSHRVRFIIRSYGPFTSGLQDVRPGATVYLDGPWGHFSPDRSAANDLVLIAGGVGITPMLSILLTRRDRGDSRRVWLFYATTDETSLIARNTLNELVQDPAIVVVPVLSRPSPDWQGVQGRISAEVLRNHLPPDLLEPHCYICGPAPMMDAAEIAAVGAGIPRSAVHTERFAMV